MDLAALRSPSPPRCAAAAAAAAATPPLPGRSRSSSCRRSSPSEYAGSRRGRAARARRRLDRLARAGARLARPRPGRLVARRPRRRRRPAARDEAGRDDDLRLPAAAGHAPQRRPLPDRDRRARLPRAAHLRLDADRRARLARRHRADRGGDRRGRGAAGSAARADADAAATLARLDTAAHARPRRENGRDARRSSAGSSRSRRSGSSRASRSRAARPCSSRRSRSRPRSCCAAVGVDDPDTVVVGARGRHRGAARCSSALRQALLVPAVVACFLAALPRRPRRLAGRQRARRDRAASRRRRALLRRHEPGRDAAARAVARRRGLGRRRGRGGDRAPAARHRRVEPGRRGRGRHRRRRRGLRRAPRWARPRPAHAGAGRRSASLGVVALALVVVGVDALLGGSSHVTDAVGGGPGTLFDDLDRRLRISWDGATSAGHTAFLCLLSLGGLAWLGDPRPASGRRSLAMLVGDRRLAARQRHAGRRARLRRARLPGAHGLGGDARAQRRSPSAAPRAAFQSRKSAPRIDAKVEPHDAGPCDRQDGPCRRAPCERQPRRCRPVRRPVRRDAVAAGPAERERDPVLAEARARSARPGPVTIRRGDGTA